MSVKAPRVPLLCESICWRQTALAVSSARLHLTCFPHSPCFCPLPVSMMLQSFTESELQHVVGNLLDRKRRRSQPPLHHNQASRTKRARKPRPCDLRKLVLKVSELGLGYESDEEMVLKYCSGRCTAHRQNYDLTMRHMVQTAFHDRRRDKVSSGPCCRPTAFEEALTFLDNRSRYHIIQNVSAKNCGCV